MYAPEAYEGNFLRFLGSALRVYKLSGDVISDDLYEEIRKYLTDAIIRFSEGETRSQTVVDCDLYFLLYLCRNHLDSLSNQGSLGNQIADQLTSGFTQRLDLDVLISRETEFLIRRASVSGWHFAFSRLEETCIGAALVFHNAGEYVGASQTLFGVIFKFLQAYSTCQDTKPR
jgi:hypothetical protein